MACRSDSSARAVTAQVLITTTSARATSAVSNPRASRRPWISWLSTWFTRQPSVA
jgi:hypothetical protein